MTKPIFVKGTVLGEGIPKICVPITGTTSGQILQQAREAAAQGAQLLEWRMDYWKEEDKKKYLEELLFSMSSILTDIPLIFTIRTEAEGGLFTESREEYETLVMIAAASQKADLIDVEVFALPEEGRGLIEKIHKKGCLAIASSHDFEKTDPQEALLERFLAMEKSGADLLKLAVMPGDFQDAVALMQATSMMKERTQKPLISMAMGRDGAITRISGENFGSCLTFACIGEPSAPGQLPLQEMRTLLEAVHRENSRE
ncbi:MAG: type I 3-dehydroquinate dehydratase [Blautia sp.]|nr:type I 3-dehydroquinate dehydratase [Blautia sp.]